MKRGKDARQKGKGPKWELGFGELRFAPGIGKWGLGIRKLTGKWGIGKMGKLGKRSKKTKSDPKRGGTSGQESPHRAGKKIRSRIYI